MNVSDRCIFNKKLKISCQRRQEFRDVKKREKECQSVESTAMFQFPAEGYKSEKETYRNLKGQNRGCK